MQTSLICDRKIPRFSMYKYLTNDFDLNDVSLHTEFEILYNRFWTGKAFKKFNKYGTIVFEKQTYTVVFHNCTCTQIYNAKKIEVSFRKPKVGYEFGSYVLVRIHHGH